jgi:hypothetical protein
MTGFEGKKYVFFNGIIFVHVDNFGRNWFLTEKYDMSDVALEAETFFKDEAHTMLDLLDERYGRGYFTPAIIHTAWKL